MTTSEEKAVALKNQGNKAFAAHDWPTAIDFYTKAIELNGRAIGGLSIEDFTGDNAKRGSESHLLNLMYP